MGFFNFKLNKESLAEEPIEIPKELADKLPKDYLEFLRTYKDVYPENEDDSICIKLKGNLKQSLYFITYEGLKRAYKDFPDGYIQIGDDVQFDGFIISTLEEDFGHVYYLGLAMYWDLVQEVPDEDQIPNIRNKAFHLANSFTEFTQKLFIMTDEEVAEDDDWFESHP